MVTGNIPNGKGERWAQCVERQEPNACTGFVTGKYCIMLDIVFCNVPYIHLDYIYAAPAILRGVVEKHGYTAKTKDFGAELYKLCGRDLDLFYQTQHYFLDPTTEVPVKVKELYNSAIEWFIDNPSEYIGISVMSYQSHVACYQLVSKIRQAGIKSKIVIGGQGIKAPSRQYLSQLVYLNSIYKTNSFGVALKCINAVDFVIEGDGEDAVLELLGLPIAQNKTADPDQISYPIPNYSDYELDCYIFDNDEPIWPITGSKGCVRDCDFCDVKHIFGKYRYKNGTDIANEMLYLNKTIGARYFQFTDSLVNGGLKPFKEWMQIIADHNKNNPDNKIRWRGNYVCRTQNQIPQGYYDLLEQSGATVLTIGAESGSNQVLESMNKKTTVEGLFDELENFRQRGISCLLLLMVGHWSETHEDFLQHLDMIIKLTPYVRSKTVTSIRIGFPAGLQLDLSEQLNKNIVRFPGKKSLYSTIYFCKHNPDNTISEKIYRQLIIIKLARRLGILDGSFLLNDLSVSKHALSEIEDTNKFYETFFETVPSSELVE